MSDPYTSISRADVPEGTHTLVDVGGREIGVFNVGGRFYALPNVCPHQNGPLCRGAVSGTVIASRETGWKRTWSHEGEIVMCPWHAQEYNITTGQSLAHPDKRLPHYHVEVDDDRVKVYARRLRKSKAGRAG